MPSIADIAELTHRYGDLLSLISVIPILADLKFGTVVRSSRKQEEKHKEAKEAAEAEEKEKEASGKSKGGKKDKTDKAAAKKEEKKKRKEEAKATPEEEEDNDDGVFLPPFWGMSLLLIAEILSSLHFLDRSDKSVMRAAGRMVRTHRDTETGFSNAIDAVEKLVSDADVYALLKFGATCIYIGTLLLLSILNRGGGGKRGIAGLKHRVTALIDWFVGKDSFQGMFTVLFVVLAMGSYFVANGDLLQEFVKKSVASQLMEAVAPLLRTAGLLSIAFLSKGANRPDAPLASWAMMEFVACFARALFLVIRERVTMAMLLGETVAGASISLGAIRSTLALEAFIALFLLPIFVRHQRYLILSALLMIPIAFCRLLSASDPRETLVITEKFFIGQTHRLSLTFVLLGMVVIFFGGFPAVACTIMVVQTLVKIHGLDTAKF